MLLNSLIRNGVITLSLITLSLITSSSLFAIEMTDYKIIEGTYQEAYINGALTVEDGNQDQTSYNGHADANYKTIHTTTLSLSKTDGTNGNSVETSDWHTTFYTGIRYRLK